MERAGHSKRRRRAVLGERERRGLFQLLICLVLFLAVFGGRSVFPTQTLQWRKDLLKVIQRDTDFRAAFTQLGRAVAEDSPIEETLDMVWEETIGGTGRQVSRPVLESCAAAAWTVAKPELISSVQQPEEKTPAQKELGLSDSVTPVLGVLTSGFGMREHPIDGGVKPHGGVDLAADTATEVRAFADGKVDYIGESPAYGMYLQLRHENGVTTFYAHCSELCVQKGELVKMGDVVARVGETGNATGPHLHFEIKKNGEFLDPEPYIDYIKQ